MDEPKFDLHSALSAMADYPAMLRRLGVIRVIEVDLAGTGIDQNAAGTVSVTATPSWNSAMPVKIAAMTTPVHLAPDRFALLAKGFLDGPAEGLGIAEIDVDSAASRLLGLAHQFLGLPVGDGVERAMAAPSETGLLSGPVSLPGLRGAGLSLAQSGRAGKLRERLKAAAAGFAHTPETTLSDPNHAVKGYVVDVWDDRSKRWHTLCARRGTYKLPGGRSFTADDEGSISTAATTKPDPTERTMIYLHESMLRWHGWSLVAPPVGTPVTTEEPANVPKPPKNGALPGFDVSFAPVPGTLPVLRFGRGYRFQLRAMDVIGRADPLNPASTDFGHAVPGPDQPPVKHLRFDPVLAPVLVPTAPMTEGESVETLVVRPDPGLLGTVSNLLAPILSTQPIRHLAPPKVSVGLCEQHGVLDTSAGRPDPAKYKTLADRDRADLTTAGAPDPRQPNQRYVSGALTVSWLSDPICRGVVVSGLPGGPAKLRFTSPLLQAWPNINPLRLQLAEGTAKAVPNPLLGILTLYVPRGETYTVQLSSFVDAGDAATLGPVDWLSAAGGDVAGATADLQAGQTWQMTPPRTLTLVNAVRTPVTAPSLVNIGNDSTNERKDGSTVHNLVANAQVHRPSTGQLSLLATLNDPVDDPDAPAPATVTTIVRPPIRANDLNVSVQAPALGIDYAPNPQTGAQVSFAASHVLGDTKRHIVNYSVEGTTRYLEHFVQRGKVTFTGITPFVLSSAGIVPGTTTIRSVDGEITYAATTDYRVDEHAGSIVRTASSAIPDGRPVEVALVVPPVTKTSPALTLDLPSTARPAPPKVSWIVPTFGWTEASTNLGLKRTRTRGGGGLRVFLERPWYSSGTGEQLAVVLLNGPASPATTQDKELMDLVTQLGTDPVTKTQAVGTAAFPAPSQFPLGKAVETPLKLPGRPDTFAVAAHDVTWDADRQRWACDIVLPPGRVYQPFVHLALARYQPNSLPGTELSAVAALEWAQLAPDRAATVLLDALDLTKVTMTVGGWSGAGTDAVAGKPNTVSVLLQTSASANPGDFDWTAAGPPDGQQLTASTQPDGTTSWTGVLRLPKPRLLTPYRLVVTERENYAEGGRLVYSDVIRL